MARWLSAAVYALASAGGVLGFIYPFLLPATPDGSQSQLTQLLTFFLLGMCLLALLVEAQGQSASGQRVAALGMLVAVAATLRFLEVALPGPAGFSPIFTPIILAGYVFGARFGFLMGSLTLMVSALITGGVGPWLPYQMMAAGWVGLVAGWLPHGSRPRLALVWLLLWGVVSGMLYGMLLNLYFWPFIGGQLATGGSALEPGGLTLRAYIAYYVASSLLWDLARSAGTALLLLAVGLPVVRVLSRFNDRLSFAVVPSRL